MAPKILVVEDDVDIGETICALLGDEGLDTAMTPTLAEARAALSEGGVDGVILDYGLPDGTGDELLEELSRVPASSPPVVLASAHPDAVAVAKHYGIAFIAKPFDLDVLIAAVRVMLEGKGRPASSGAVRPSVKIRRA